MKYNSFLVCDADILSLPIGHFDSARECASFIGCDVQYLWRCIRNHSLCCGYEVIADVIV